MKRLTPARAGRFAGVAGRWRGLTAISVVLACIAPACGDSVAAGQPPPSPRGARAEPSPGEGSLLLADARFTSAGADAPPGRLPTRFPELQSADRALAGQRGVRLDAPLAETLRWTAGTLALDLAADDFADNDPGTLSFAMAGLDVDATRSVAGGRAEIIAANSERGRALVETRLSWLFEYLQTPVAATPFFAPGEKGIFAVQGFRYGSNWALLGWGVRFKLADGWSATAGYDAQANGQQLFHIGSGTVNYTW